MQHDQASKWKWKKCNVPGLYPMIYLKKNESHLNHTLKRFQLIFPQISADYIKACSRSDPKFDECAYQSARASLKKFARGDKERNIPELDPLRVKEIRAIGNKNQNGLNVIFTDCKLTGCADLDLIKFKYVLHAFLTEFTITVTNRTHSVWKLCSQCRNG